MRWNRVGWAAVAAGAAVRLVWVFVVHPPSDFLFSDMQGYVQRATNLASGAAPVRFDVLYPPGTHLLLALPLKAFGTGPDGLRGGGALWWALSSAVPLFAWRVARRLLDPREAALAAVLVAAYPLFVFYAGFFSSETPAMALLLGCLWLCYRARQESAGRLGSALGAGALGAATAAVRPQLLLNVAIAAIPLLVGTRAATRARAAFAGAFAVVVVCVLAYNAVAAGRITGLSENGGVVFFQAHCRVHQVTAGSAERGGIGSFGNPVAAQRDTGRDYRFPDHQVWDQGFFYRKAFGCIGSDGLSHLGVMGRALLDSTATTTPFPLFAPKSLEPPARAVNLSYSILLPAIVLGAIALVVRRRRRGHPAGGEGELLLHLLAFVPVVVIFSSEPRYRILYDVFGLMLLAALLSRLPWGRLSPAGGAGRGRAALAARR